MCQVGAIADRSWRDTPRAREAERQRQANARAADPERFREYTRQRRLRRLAAGGDLSTEQWKAIVGAYAGLCAYCDQPATTQDHVLPLTRGGEHSAGNVVPACRSCNSRKRTRTADEWATRGGRVLDIGPHPFMDPFVV